VSRAVRTGKPPRLCPPTRQALYVIACLMLMMLSLRGSRIKDLSVVSGVRENQLYGYGLVVGLSGDGDSNLESTLQSVSNFLQDQGINLDPADLKSDNVAAVMVTADIPPFLKPGSRISVTVSSIGDADTLQGGVLLQTPLLGADGTVYAVAQGAIAVGGFLEGSSGAGGATVQQNHPTVGTIPNGAIVEREIRLNFEENGVLDFLLLNPDFMTAVRLADAINKVYPASAKADDAATVNVRIPPAFRGQTPNFIAAVGSLEVMPDNVARVIINEKTGTIVATANVRISTVAVSHGSLTITIAENLNVSQPNPLGEGDTVVTPATEVEVTEQKGGFRIVEDFPTIDRLTAALNALGVTNREMMSILQSLKTAGALQAELILQ